MESEASVTVIRELLRGMNSQQVTAAEARMKEITKSKQFFSNIFFILTSSQQQDWIRTMAASYINHHFTDMLNQQNSQTIAEALVRILSNPDVKDLDKRTFQKAIIRCLDVSTQAQNQKWLLFISQCLKNMRLYDTAFLLIACIAVADIPTTLLERIIVQTYQPILSNMQVSIQNANLLNQMIKMWIVIIDKLRQEKNMSQLLQRMVDSANLFRIISCTYQMHSSQNSIICFQKELLELNLLKYQAAELHKRILEIEVKKEEEKFTALVGFTQPYINRFASTLIGMAANRNQMQAYNCEDLVTTLLSLIRLYIVINPEEITLDQAINIQNQIIFPLLPIDQTQLNRFQQSPEDFNSLAEDCCDKQTFGILKTQAAKLLECLGDKVPGSLKYTFNRAVHSIKVKFGQPYFQNQSGLQILQIQTAFLVLSIFSYGINNYPEQQQAIFTILNNERTKYLAPLDLARVFTFLAYNYFQIFKDPVMGQQWLSLAISYKAHPTTRYCAFDCFSNIIEEYFNQMFLQRIGDEIQIGNIGLVWDIIIKVIEKHYDSLSHNGISLITSKLFLRIQRQLNLLKTKEKSNSLDIINCLRTFVFILKEVKGESKQNFERKQFIIRSVWPILDFYQEAKKLGIQDEVVKITIQLINSMDVLQSQIFRHVAHYIEDFKGTTSNYSDKIYFRLFNQIFLKADFQKDGEEIIKIMVVLKDTLLYTLAKLYDNNTKKIRPVPHLRLVLSNALIVIQTSIAMFGPHLIKSQITGYFEQISSLCVRLLPLNQNEAIQKTPSGYIILSRALNTLFLCHMHMRIDSIYAYLQRLQDERLYHGFDTKVIVMCIAKQIFNETDVTAIAVLLTSVRKFVENSQAKNETLQKNKKTKTNSYKISSQMKKITDFDKIIANIDSPFKNDQEISSILTQMFAEMKQGNSQMYDTILKALPSDVLKYFNTFIDLNNVQKRKRVFVKVIGVKLNSSGTSSIDAEQDTKNQKMNEGSDQDQQADLGFKRTKTKLKLEGKRKKMIKLDYKREHIEVQQT